MPIRRNCVILNKMTTTTITENAEKIRDVIRYIKRFKNAVIVIYIDDKIIDSPLFSSHISDIALMHEAKP